MKFTSLITVAMLAIVAPLAHAHADHGKPQYGGIFGEAGMFQAELVLGAHEATVYLTIHGQPLASAGTTGKLVILEGSGKVEVVLKPAGDNRLHAVLKSKPGTGSTVVANIKTPQTEAPANIRYVIE